MNSDDSLDSEAPLKFRDQWILYKDLLFSCEFPRKHGVRIVLLILGGVVFSIAEPYLYLKLIENLTSNISNVLSAGESSSHIEKVSIIIGIWVLFFVLSTAINGYYDWFIRGVTNWEWKNMLVRTTWNMFQMPFDYHLSTDVWTRHKITDRAGEAFWSVARETYLTIIPNSLVFLAAISLGIWIDWRMILVTIVPLITSIPFALKIGDLAHSYQNAADNLWNRAFGRLSDGFGNIRMIRLFTREKHELEVMKAKFEDAVVVQRKIHKLWVFLEVGGNTLGMGAQVLVVGFGTYFILQHSLTIAELFLFFTLSSRIYNPVKAIESAYRNVTQYLPSYRKAKEVLDATKEPDTGKRKFKSVQRSIVFNDVTFSYPGGKREVLKNLNLEVKKWEKIALVGHTGSGKSTVVNLITRFYKPVTGTICVDETDIYEFGLTSYRSRFAAVFQDTTLFNDTIEHNLSYVRDDLTKKQIKQACRDANILDFIESLPEWLASMVGERWLKLSGGEKQRIAIARAILADPEILILDEATSALDSKTEKLVGDALERLMKNRTSVIIAHRLSTIKNVDRIYLFESGKLLWSGTHKELYASSPVYQEMVNYQRDGFVE